MKRFKSFSRPLADGMFYVGTSWDPQYLNLGGGGVNWGGPFKKENSVYQAQLGLTRDLPDPDVSIGGVSIEGESR